MGALACEGTNDSVGAVVSIEASAPMESSDANTTGDVSVKVEAGMEAVAAPPQQQPQSPPNSPAVQHDGNKGVSESVGTIDLKDMEEYIQMRIREAMKAKDEDMATTDGAEKVVIVQKRDDSSPRHRHYPPASYEESDYDIEGL
jgi:hypothetical protein